MSETKPVMAGARDALLGFASPAEWPRDLGCADGTTSDSPIPVAVLQ